jgi:outer membrane protein
VIRSEIFPSLDLSLQATRTRRTGGREQIRGLDARNEVGPGIDLNYLLYDFGRRAARIDATESARRAAHFSYNRALQRVVLSVQQAYYSYVALEALRRAQDKTLEEAKVITAATHARRDAGFATHADVLQAVTRESQALLNLETTKGSMRALSGRVLSAVGLPPDTPVKLATPSLEDLSIGTVDEEVESLLARAKRENPELLAARSRVEESRSLVAAAQRASLPSFGMSASLDQLISGGTASEDYTASLVMRLPLFTGFRLRESVREAQAEAQRMSANASVVERDVTSQLWSDYHTYQTAKVQIRVSEDLVRSASESLAVAQGRYQEGVGSILDLLEAQRAVEEARVARVDAYSGWLLALARLRFDVGGSEAFKGVGR